MESLPLLPGIPGIVRLAVRGTPDAVDVLGKMGIDPKLAIISRRLYPDDEPDLVIRLRRIFPGIRFLLISSPADPFPPLQPLIADRIRHLAIDPDRDDDRCGRRPQDFAETLEKLANGRALEIGDYLEQGTTVREYPVTSSDQKEELISALLEIIPDGSADLETVRQRGALLADELLENALYGAPQGEDGRKLYRKGEERAIARSEGIVFRFGFDGRTLALEVADSWGSLSPDLLMEYLARNQEDDGTGSDGGGRGLFIIWRFLDRFHVTIDPGRETVVGGQLMVASPLDPEVPRGFYISAPC